MNLLSLLLLLFLCSDSLSSPVSAASNGKARDAHNLLSFKSSLPNPEILSNWEEYKDPCLFTGVFCNNDSSRVTSLDLTSLSLSSNFASIATHLFPIELLTSVTLKSANISGHLQAFSLCSASLAGIDLAENSIAGDFSDLNHFVSCSNLKTLNLSSNLLGFSSSSKDLKRAHFKILLETLDVSSNYLLSGNNQVLPWVLSGGCDSLRHLAMKGNKLVGGFSLSRCSKLESFDVSLNNFSTPLPKFGQDCPSLRYLDLSSNRFYGEIGDSFLGLKSLSYLNVSNNQLSGGFPELLLGPGSSLEFLYLGNNKLQGLIPQSFADDSCSTLVE